MAVAPASWLAALALALALVTAAPIRAHAQTSVLAGAWESTIRVGERGEPIRATVFAIYLPGGQFVELSLPANRPRLDTALDEMTRDELLARLRGTAARRGTYRLEGDRLIRTSVSHLDPGAEGRTEIDLVSIERDAFVVRSLAPANQSEIRFRRLSPRAVANALVAGVWERVSEQNETGETRQPPAAGRIVYYSPDGYFAALQIPSNRPKVARAVDAMTNSELLARFSGVVISAGSYSVAGNRLTRNETKHINPSYEGRLESDIWRIENEILVLSSSEPGSKAEARFRRIEP